MGRVARFGPSCQGFIQALFLTSVFPEGLSFMTAGQNPPNVRQHIGPCSWGFMLMEVLVISAIPGFPCIIW